MNASVRSRIIAKWLFAAVVPALVVSFALTKPLSDFVEYWSAAHLLVAGRNPYSLVEMLRFEQALGWGQRLPLMVLNPPWVLPIVAPLGFIISFPIAWLIWVAGLTAVIALSTALLSSTYGFSEQFRPLLAVALTSVPTLFCLMLAQITPLLLLGIAGFLWCHTRKRFGLAGAFLALTTFKPHLVYLVLLGVVLDSLRQRRWQIPAGASAVIGTLTGIALAIDPRALVEYWQLSTSSYTAMYPSALGAMLRHPSRLESIFTLQFAPAVVGLTWFLFHWRKHRLAWDWPTQMPIVLTVSVLTTAYGWVFDQTLLTVPIITVACRHLSISGQVPERVTRLYTRTNLVLLIMLGLAGYKPDWAWRPLSFMVAPVVLLFALREVEHANSPRARSASEGT